MDPGAPISIKEGVMEELVRLNLDIFGAESWNVEKEGDCHLAWRGRWLDINIEGVVDELCGCEAGKSFARVVEKAREVLDRAKWREQGAGGIEVVWFDAQEWIYRIRDLSQLEELPVEYTSILMHSGGETISLLSEDAGWADDFRAAFEDFFEEMVHKGFPAIEFSLFLYRDFETLMESGYYPWGVL